MNLLHRWICSSNRWGRAVEQYIMPWTLDGLDLGPKLLEIGPGYGATTDLLQHHADELTCVEIDTRLAEGLRRREFARNVTILCEDATKMSLPDRSFDAAVCFTMLHHIPSAQLQDRLLAEVARVLRPGGIFAGTDSLDGRLFRLIHLFDTLMIVDPNVFHRRLAAAGFINVEVDVNNYAFRFRARKPLEN